MSEARLVAVLGYSCRPDGDLHPVCSGRVTRALEEAGPHDAVLLSGLAEAGAMARSWSGRPARLLLDEQARSTLGNARATAAAARELAVREVVVVTSAWHGRRASFLVRAALRGSGATVRLAAAPGRGPASARLRELACWLAAPVQAALATRRRP